MRVVALFASATVLAALATVAVGLYQQKGPCADACAVHGLECAGTTAPPWGDDMRCSCVPPPPRNYILVPPPETTHE